MNNPHENDTYDTLGKQLRQQAQRQRRTPSADLHDRIMAAVRRHRAATSGESIISRPLFVTRRLLAAAAMILIVALVVLVLRPESSQEPLSPQLTAGGALANDQHPQLVQSLLDLAPRFAFDVTSPLDDEADRMLADARHAGRVILIENLPFRGRAADAHEARDF